MDGLLRDQKPKMTSSELIEHLKAGKVVKFERMDCTAAASFLEEKNNYFRIISYKQNYKKPDGKYIGMDFACLVELSKLDMYLRNLIIKTCIDIEHCLKVTLLRDIENNSLENGYDIVEEFLSIEKNQYILNSIKRKSKSYYCGELIQYYFRFAYINGVYKFDCPVWTFLEMITFGNLVDFYVFYYKKYGSCPINPKILNSVRSLRNACAHNNCILHDLRQDPEIIVCGEVNRYVSSNPNIGSETRRKKFHVKFMVEFCSLIYVFENMVSCDIKRCRKEELKEFSKNRLINNITYFNSNPLIKSSLTFLKNIIDFL